MDKKVVYKEQEVRLTGRVAYKNILPKKNSRLVKGTVTERKPPRVVEIEALPDPNTDAKPWTKWVEEKDLFYIEDEKDLDLLIE
jgi:hypothetical protein